MDRLVSVIIPSYNRAHLLPTTIPAYLQPEVGELIVVDDGSLDNTPDVVKKLQLMDARIKYARLVVNSGQAAAINQGIKMARYPYIYFGDDDSYLLEGTINRLLSYIKNGRYDLIGIKALYMLDNESEQAVIRRYSKIKKPIININRLADNFGVNVPQPVKVPFVPASLLVKTCLAKQVKFDPSFKGNGYREETDFIIRCAKEGAVVAYCSEGAQINLPRTIAAGGAWAQGLVNYEISAIRNNWLFLQRHYKYLYDNWDLRTPLVLLQLIFIYDRTLIFFKKAIKSLIGRKNSKLKLLFCIRGPH